MTRTILTITQAILVCTVIAVHADPIPAGLLGFPLGTYLTIEGVRPDDGMKVNPTCTLVVDVVNSNKLDEPVLIAVENLAGRYFPTNSRIVIRGYESGEMIGVPDEVAQAERLSVPQVPWQFYRYFVLTSCVEPKEFPTHDMESGAERRAQRRKLTTRNSQPADTIEFETTTQQLDVVRSGRLAEFILQHPKIPPAIIDGSAEVPSLKILNSSILMLETQPITPARLS